MSDNLSSLFGDFQFTNQEGFTDSNPENRSSGNRFTIMPKSIKIWRPTAGEESKIRFLPQLTKPYFAEETRGHYRVGAAGHSFGCPHMLKQECPLCTFAKEKYNEADAEDDKERQDAIKKVAKDYNGVVYYCAYMLDRRAMDKGVQMYMMTVKAYESIYAVLTDDHGKALPIDHPVNGYDITFTLPKKSENKYASIEGVKAARNPSPVTLDPFKGVDSPEKAADWVRYIKEHPIREAVQFLPFDEMKELAFGSIVTSNTQVSSNSHIGVQPSNFIDRAESAVNQSAASTSMVAEAFQKSLEASATPSTEESPSDVDFDAKMAEMQKKLAAQQ